jgi:hypothetical protein
MHDSRYNMAAFSDLIVPNMAPCDILIWARDHVSCTDSAYKYEDTIPTFTDGSNDADCLVCSGCLFQDKCGSIAHSAKSATPKILTP